MQRDHNHSHVQVDIKDLQPGGEHDHVVADVTDHGAHHAPFVQTDHDALPNPHHGSFIQADHDGLPNPHHASFVQADHDGLPNPHHSNATDHAQSHAHGSHTGIGAGDHHTAFVQTDHDALPNPHHSNANDHAAVHTVVSHDTTATGANLNTLTGGGQTALHSHAGGGGGPDVKSGIVAVQEGGSANVTFGTPFTATPVVVCTVNDAGGEDNGLTITARSTTGFTVHMIKLGGGAGSTYNVGWIATDAGNP